VRIERSVATRRYRSAECLAEKGYACRGSIDYVLDQWRPTVIDLVRITKPRIAPMPAKRYDFARIGHSGFVDGAANRRMLPKITRARHCRIVINVVEFGHHVHRNHG